MKLLWKKHKLLVIGIPCTLIVIIAGVIGYLQYQKSKEVKACITMGNHYLSELDYEQAITSYRQALDLDTKNKEANLGLAQAYDSNNMYTYAESIYKTMLDEDDTQEEVYEKLADLYMRQEKLEEAKKESELQEKQIIVQTQYADEQDETLNVADQVAAKKKLIKYYESLGCKRNQNVNTCTGVAAVDGWVYPLNRFYQTSNYGYDENRYHYAVDLHAPEGSSVKAVGNGEVIYSGVYWRVPGVSSCGGLVIQIRHTYNGVDYISLYMHMLSSNVGVGTKVSAGQVIGTSGGGSQSIAKYNDKCTGGAHLHFTMAYAGDADIYNTPSSSQGTTFNPVRFFPAFKGIGSTYNW